ncbi:MAG: hypothetical protein NZ953_04610 [Thaumarchaeota archaeon]|nr:hypothetical protein [Candidatus Calditenuaceae archaeon]
MRFVENRDGALVKLSHRPFNPLREVRVVTKTRSRIAKFLSILFVRFDESCLDLSRLY